jgi:RsmE family RNA methyltransferase
VHNDDRIMIIGPEGGFSASEVDMASATVSLGDNILRADTAAIVGATLMVAHGAR